VSEEEEFATEPIDDPEVVEALKIIIKNDPDGIAQPSTVVEAARDPKSPFHQYIWAKSDEDAAYEYRLSRARHLITRVVVREVRERVAMVNVVVKTVEGKLRRGYVPVERAVIDDDLYAQVVAECHRGIMSYRNRLSAFERARPTVVQLDAALAAMKPDEEEAA
jgi:hypothetical protein